MCENKDMAILTLTLKLPFYRLNQCKAQEFDRLAALNTDIANQLEKTSSYYPYLFEPNNFYHVISKKA